MSSNIYGGGPFRRHCLAGGSSVAAILSVLAVSPAIAAEPANPGSGVATPDGSAATTADILVTARRRVENVQKVPIAISVISGTELERNGARGIEEIRQLVPSLQVLSSNPRNVNINIRGLGTSVGTASDGLENGVGFYVDDVYYGRPAQALFDLFDLDRVEVLRGPQGTLFGKNTTAGAISVTSRAPSFTPGGLAELSLGDYAYKRGRAALNLPLIDDVLAVRLSGSYTKRDGDWYNVRTGVHDDNVNRWSVRGQLLFTPTSNFRLLVSGDYGIEKERCCLAITAGGVTTRVDGSPLPNDLYDRAARAGYTLLPNEPFARLVDGNIDSRYRMWQGGGSAKADLDLGWATLTSITAGRFWRWFPTNDADGLGVQLFTIAKTENRQNQFSQEIRLASRTGGTFDYVVGGYYFYQNVHGLLTTQYGPDIPSWVFGAATPAAIAGSVGYTTFGASDARTWSYAAFGQTTWHITPELSLTPGLRFTHERKTGVFDQTVSGGADLAALPADEAAAALTIRQSLGAPLSYRAGLSNNSLGGQINLSYQITPRILAYATYSRGAKSGGLNLVSLPLAISPVIKPEHVTNYEAGIKSTLFGNRLTLDANAFWTIDRGYQTTVLVNTVTYLANVGKVRSRGVELDARLSPVRGLSLYGSLLYDDAKILSYPNAPCPVEYRGLATVCDLAGRRLPGASKWSISAGGEYSVPLDAWGFADTSAYVGVDYSYRSSFYDSNNDSIYSIIPSYDIVNARLGVRVGKRWDASIWARNLFDKDYYEYFQPGAFNSGILQTRPGEPRTWGFTLRAQF
jgi:iron complex outermembrane receptor protein